LGIEPTSFLAFAQMETDSPYHFRLDISEEAYCLALNMREQPDGSRRCIFLMELPGGQTRCGIYSLRPIACRAYPLTLAEDGVVVKPWAMCPERFLVPSQPDIDSWQQELERHDMEFSIYALLVESWNRRAMTLPKSQELNFRPLVDFVMEFYQRLEPSREAVTVQEWPGIWKHWRRFTGAGVNPLSRHVNDAEGSESWRWWVESIRRAVVQSVQALASHAVDPEMLPEEIVV